MKNEFQGQRTRTFRKTIILGFKVRYPGKDASQSLCQEQSQRSDALFQQSCSRAYQGFTEVSQGRHIGQHICPTQDWFKMSSISLITSFEDAVQPVTVSKNTINHVLPTRNTHTYVWSRVSISVSVK